MPKNFREEFNNALKNVLSAQEYQVYKQVTKGNPEDYMLMADENITYLVNLNTQHSIRLTPSSVRKERNLHSNNNSPIFDNNQAGEEFFNYINSKFEEKIEESDEFDL